jgi:hypothetical protein
MIHENDHSMIYNDLRVKYGRWFGTVGILYLCLAAGSVAPAAADDLPNPNARADVASPYGSAGALPEGVGVIDRARPEYDAQGIQTGAFTFYPSLAADLSFDDNIRRTAAATISDLFWTVSPRLDMRSIWSQDSLRFYGQYDHLFYDSHDSESRANWIAGGAGLWSLTADTGLNANAYYLDTHESRASPDISLSALKPTEYALFHADAALTNQSGPLGLAAGVIYDRRLYDPTLLAGGSKIDNADRNSRVTDGYGRASYEFAPGGSAYLQASYNTRDFDLKLDRAGLEHTSSGYRLDSGLDMQLSPLVKGTVFVGYLQQNFKAPFHDVSGIDFGSQVDWFATQLITVHLATARNLYDTTIPGASSEDERTVRLSADYEFLRNLIIQPNLGYENDIFDGISRDDRIVTAGLNVKYLITQQFSLYANYAHSERDSNVGGNDFSDNLVSVGLRLQE